MLIFGETEIKKKRMYTWSQPNPLIRCRLDYFLASNDMVRYVKNARILPSIKTDHSIIELILKVDGPKRGPGFWKLNTSILEEESYVLEIKALIKKVWEDANNIENLNTRYDWLKYNIRKYTIDYCKQRAKSKKLKENKIIDDIQLLDVKICNETASEDELNTYKNLKNELEHIEEERARGHWIRSGLERIENDEKSTSFFLNKAKSNFPKENNYQHKIRFGYRNNKPERYHEGIKIFLSKPIYIYICK